MKSSYRNSMIISFIFFSFIIQVYPIKAETVLEYQANIADVVNYSVAKLNHLSENGENISIRKNIQLNRIIWDMYGNKFSFLETSKTVAT